MAKIIKTFKLSGTAGHRRLAKFTATAGVVAQASAATDKIAGVFDFPGGATDGQDIDVVLFGLAEVEAGGTFAAGDNLVSDADGKAVAAAPAAGVNNVTAGRGYYPAVSGDRVQIFVNPSNVQG